MEGFFKRFITAVSGGAKSAGDSIMETDVMSQAELTGSIAKMESALDNAKRNHVILVGNANTARREAKEIEEKYNLNVSAARKAIANNNDEEKFAFAKKADEYKEELIAKNAELAEYEKGIESQKASIKQIEANLAKIKRGEKMLKAEKAVVNASRVASANLVGIDKNESANAMAVLERQRAKIAEEKDLVAASQSVYEESKSIDASEYLSRNNDESDTLAMLMAEKETK
jgi:PspA/IM30 family.